MVKNNIQRIWFSALRNGYLDPAAVCHAPRRLMRTPNHSDTSLTYVIIEAISSNQNF